MKKFMTVVLAVVMTAALCLVGCKKDNGKTAPPESVTITNTQTTLTAGEHTLTAAVKPDNASQAVTWTLIGSPLGVTLNGNKLTVEATAPNETQVKVKVAAQTDPTISDTKTFTVDNPPAPAIEISTEAELKAMELYKNYKLVNDITLTDIWEPLGSADVKDEVTEAVITPGEGLSGTFDGNGYTIKNFNTDGGGYNKGFFYKIDPTGVVKNLGIESGKETEDGLNGAAWDGVLAGENNGTVENCYTDVQVTMSGTPAGALLGTNNGTIENSYAIGPVKVGAGAHGSALVTANNGTITQSFVLDSSVVAAVGWNKTQDAKIQKSESWMKTAQNYKDAGWSEDVWSLVDGYYPQLKHTGFVAPSPLPVLNITNAEEYLDYNDEEQRELQITYSLSNVTNNAVTFALKAPVTGVSISESGLITLSDLVADGAKFTVVVTSVEVNTLSVEKTFTVNHVNTEEVVEIGTLEELKELINTTNPADMAKSYRLTADIDASGEFLNNAIAPIVGENDIPKAETAFTGTFDGNGYTIIGFKGGGETGWNKALFGEIGVGGVVKNLTLEIGDRCSGNNGAGIAVTNNGTIENVKLISAEGGAIKNSGEKPQAGIAYFNGGTIKNCIMMAKLNINYTTQSTVKGIASENLTGGTIENCFVDTTVTGITQVLGEADEALDAACIKTTAEMKAESLYSAFDKDVWNITDGEYHEHKKGIRLAEVVKITTEEQLRAIASDERYLSANIILMNNIALTEEVAESGNYWTAPIGTVDKPFTGTFDGNGYTISNVKNATAQNNFGFFGVVSGTVKNLCVDTSGKLVTGSNSAVLMNILNDGGVVENCLTKGEIASESRWIAGFIRTNDGTVKNSIATVIISHTTADKAKGGFHVGAYHGTFENVMFDTDVAASSEDPNVSTGAVKFCASSEGTDVESAYKTTEELKTAATFDNTWSSDIWNIADGSVPTLKNGCTTSAGN